MQASASAASAEASQRLERAVASADATVGEDLSALSHALSTLAEHDLAFKASLGETASALSQASSDLSAEQRDASPPPPDCGTVGTDDGKVNTHEGSTEVGQGSVETDTSKVSKDVTSVSDALDQAQAGTAALQQAQQASANTTVSHTSQDLNAPGRQAREVIAKANSAIKVALHTAQGFVEKAKAIAVQADQISSACTS